jgi:hypothetical protein
MIATELAREIRADDAAAEGDDAAAADVPITAGTA